MLELESTTESNGIESTAAARQADFNYRQNLRALRETQPQLATSGSIASAVQWLFARDGSLTAADQDGKWKGGCSVPHRAAQELLRTLDISAGVTCFLAPTHAAQLAVALQRLRAHQAVIALIPQMDDLTIALHCQDFSKEIAAHRLWFVAGGDWPDQLAQLFHANPGLTIPQQFIRTALLTEEAAAPLIETAQKIFSQEHQQRTTLIAQLRDRSISIRHAPPRITLAAPMHFRPWDDAGATLANIIAADSACAWTTIDFDDPLSASPLALAEAAADCDAIVTVNLVRADCPDLLPAQIPLITWLTRPKIPSIASAGPRDALLLADPQWLDIAKDSGWPASRIAVARWPQIASPISSTSPATLTIIADTHPLDSPATFDLSSHQLLWELIHNELFENPLLCGPDILAYLRLRMSKLGVSDDGLDHRRFIDDLIVPAYQQGLVRQLLKSNLPLRIFGEGWPNIAAFAAYSAGPIRDRPQLQSALATSAALIHLWPSAYAHPIDTAGPPIIHPMKTGPGGLIQAARRALAGSLKPALPPADVLGLSTIAHLLRELPAD